MPKEQPPEVSGFAKKLQSIARLRALLIPAMILGCIAGAIALWRQFGDDVVASHPDQYQVALERLTANAPPSWVKADVRGEVFRDAGWQEQPLSILEEDLTVRVAQAFEQHTWVAKVTRVTKQSPATVNVEIQYRKPVAMVEVDYQGQGGLLPVDEHAVLLPPEDFTAEEAITFPRITVDYSGPGGSVGTPWGDQRVAGGAKIAALLSQDWNGLGLYRIVALESKQPTSVTPPAYEIHTRGESRVSWGHSPDDEIAGEATGQQKLARLLRYAEQNGPLDRDGAEVEVDVRNAERLSSRGGTDL